MTPPWTVMPWSARFLREWSFAYIPLGTAQDKPVGTLMVVPGAITVVMMLVVSYPTDPSVPLTGSLDRGDRRWNGTNVDICDRYFKGIDGSWYGALMIFAVMCVSNVVEAVLKSNNGWR